MNYSIFMETHILSNKFWEFKDFGIIFEFRHKNPELLYVIAQ